MNEFGQIIVHSVFFYCFTNETKSTVFLIIKSLKYELIQFISK